MWVSSNGNLSKVPSDSLRLTWTQTQEAKLQFIVRFFFVESGSSLSLQLVAGIDSVYEVFFMIKDEHRGAYVKGNL